MRALALLLAVGLVHCKDDDPPANNPNNNNNDESWNEAFDAEELGWFLSAWGPSADDVYAVGGTPESGRIMHFDGTDWSEMTVETGTIPLMNWVYGFSSTDVVMVGNEGAILRYDGTSFTREQAPTDQDLWGVWGASSDDLWAVGGRGRQAGDATIVHYDGNTWTTLEDCAPASCGDPKAFVPTLQRPNVFAYFKVWGTGANNVYVVGQRGVVLHYDGTVWTEEFVGASDDLVALWGTGPDRIAVVGGRGNGQVVTWNGADWTQKDLAPKPGLNGVWMHEDSTVYIGGEDGYLAELDFDSLTPTDAEKETQLVIHAIFGHANEALYAVGGSLLSTEAPHRGVALRRSLSP